MTEENITEKTMTEDNMSEVVNMTKEEKKRVMDFCRSYIPTRLRIARTQNDITVLEKRVNAGDISAFEKQLIKDNIQYKRDRIEEDRKTLLVFELAMTDLDRLDLLVFRQLYVEGRRQNEVTDESGTPIGERRVRRIRDRGLEKIGLFLLERICLISLN